MKAETELPSTSTATPWTPVLPWSKVSVPTVLEQSDGLDRPEIRDDGDPRRVMPDMPGRADHEAHDLRLHLLDLIDADDECRRGEGQARGGRRVPRHHHGRGDV